MATFVATYAVSSIWVYMKNFITCSVTFNMSLGYNYCISSVSQIQILYLYSCALTSVHRFGCVYYYLPPVLCLQGEHESGEYI